MKLILNDVVAEQQHAAEDMEKDDEAPQAAAG